MTREEKETIATQLMAIDLRSDSARSARRRALEKLNQYVSSNNPLHLSYAIDELGILCKVLLDAKAPNKASQVKSIGQLLQPHIDAAGL
jgi:hypothetical protein